MKKHIITFKSGRKLEIIGNEKSTGLNSNWMEIVDADKVRYMIPDKNIEWLVSYPLDDKPSKSEIDFTGEQMKKMYDDGTEWKYRDGY